MATGGSILDNVTHALHGFAIYGAWVSSTHADVHTALASGVCAAAIIGSEAPDFDYFIKVFAGPPAYLRQHRAISHSVPFWIIWALVTSIGLSFWLPHHFGLFFFISLLGVIVHVGLDMLTTYGTQAFWPFSKKRWAFDVDFVVDFVLIACGILGVWLGYTVWSSGMSLRVFVPIAVLNIVFRWVTHTILFSKLRKTFGVEYKISLLPRPLPWWWSFVAENSSEIIAGQMKFSGRIEPEVKWSRPNERSEAVRFAFEQTKVGQAYEWFARHLLWKEHQDGEVTRISIADAMYRYHRQFPFSAYVAVKRTDGGKWGLVTEGMRGQSVDLNALFRDVFDGKDELKRQFKIPSPTK